MHGAADGRLWAFQLILTGHSSQSGVIIRDQSSARRSWSASILTHKGAQSTLFYRLTQSSHYPLIIAQIVNGIQAGAEYFLAFVQMMKVSPEKF